MGGYLLRPGQGWVLMVSPSVFLLDEPTANLIAGTALTEGLELATLNLRHYPMFPDLARPF